MDGELTDGPEQQVHLAKTTFRRLDQVVGILRVRNRLVQAVDLRSQTGKFATIDYSDEKPALYLGEMVEFESLVLKNLRTFEGWS